MFVFLYFLFLVFSFKFEIDKTEALCRSAKTVDKILNVIKSKENILYYCRIWLTIIWNMYSI